jgi:hypothetical protein
MDPSRFKGTARKSRRYNVRILWNDIFKGREKEHKKLRYVSIKTKKEENEADDIFDDVS